MVLIETKLDPRTGFGRGKLNGTYIYKYIYIEV